MLLQDKNAVIFGATGSLGSVIARAFAAEGATVHISSRNLDRVKTLADEINQSGGKAVADQADVLNEDEVHNYLQSIETTIDIALNAIAWEDTQGKPLTEMTIEEFTKPIRISTTGNFITSTAVAEKMKAQGSGVILSLTATPGGIGYANVGGFGPACCAIESLSRNLAAELGVHGIRVVNIRSAGSPDSKVFTDALEQGGEAAKKFINKLAKDTMLNQLPMIQDIADTAVLVASDKASKITGTTIDVTVGTTSALNYETTPIEFVDYRHPV